MMKSAVFAAGLAFAVVPLFAQEDVPEQIRSRETYTAIGIVHDYENFDDNLSDWNLTSLELKRKGTYGSIIGRVTHGERFDTTGQQFEVDAYPRLGDGTYAYLNFGYSDDSIFPRYRAGAQIYRSLPRSWEASVGARWLDFESDDVTLWTGSIGKYTGNWYVSLQPYLRDTEHGTSASANLLARRYFATADDYFGFRVGYGENPEQDIFLGTDLQFQSWSASLEAKRRVTDRFVIRGSVGTREQEVRRDFERGSFFASLGLETRF